jgi:hypothetical protein
LLGVEVAERLGQTMGQVAEVEVAVSFLKQKFLFLRRVHII